MWAGLGEAGGDDVRGDVEGGARRSNRWRAVTERRMARASAAPNTQAESKREKQGCLNKFCYRNKKIYTPSEHKGAAEHNKWKVLILPQNTYWRWADRVVLLAAEDH